MLILLKYRVEIAQLLYFALNSIMQLSVSVRNDHLISVVNPETMDLAVTHQLFDIFEEDARKLRERGERVFILVDVRQVKHDVERVR